MRFDASTWRKSLVLLLLSLLFHSVVCIIGARRLL